MSTKLKTVTIFTDGSKSPNPGRGGYGGVLRYGEHVKELSGGFELTTNNRMEQMAVIVALESLKLRCRLRLYNVSRYVVDAITKGWARDWREDVGRQGQSKGFNLWELLLSVCEQRPCRLSWSL